MANRQSLTQKVISNENQKREDTSLKEGVTKDSQNTDLNDRITSIENKLNLLIDILNSNHLITENCPKNPEGKRQLPL